LQPSFTVLPMAATPRDDIRPPLPAVRIGDDDRQRAIARLSDAYAQDVIAVEEFEHRVEAVYRASERGELVALTQDLPTTAAEKGAKTSVAISDDSDHRRISSVFSNVERTGFTEMPRRLDIRVFAGNVELDLSRTQFPPGVTEIAIKSTLGNVEIFLPSGITVENEGVALLGSFDLDAAERPRADGQFGVAIPWRHPSVVRITGRALLSSVEITQLPGPTP